MVHSLAVKVNLVSGLEGEGEGRREEGGVPFCTIFWASLSAFRDGQSWVCS